MNRMKFLINRSVCRKFLPVEILFYFSIFRKPFFISSHSHAQPLFTFTLNPDTRPSSRSTSKSPSLSLSDSHSQFLRYSRLSLDSASEFPFAVAVGFIASQVLSRSSFSYFSIYLCSSLSLRFFSPTHRFLSVYGFRFLGISYW
jgi:hypothetical protein